MAIDATFYGTLEEADEYFANRLHETAWSEASANDRRKALVAARGIIDALNYKGNKHSVYTLLQANPSATQDADQGGRGQPALGVSRGADTEVPEAIRVAAYEIAHALLDGKDPELELENLAVSTMGYGAVKTSFERSQLPIEHVINLVPSSAAWRLLEAFLARLGRHEVVTTELRRVPWLPFTGPTPGQTRRDRSRRTLCNFLFGCKEVLCPSLCICPVRGGLVSRVRVLATAREPAQVPAQVPAQAMVPARATT